MTGPVHVLVLCRDDPETERRVRVLIAEAMREAGYGGGPAPEDVRPRLRLVHDEERVS